MANLSNINGKFVVEQTTGYVGIGDTDPDYLLHIASADAVNGTRLAIENTNGSGKIYGLISDNTGVFTLRDVTATTDRLTISSGGDATFAGKVSLPDNKYLSWTGSNTRMIGNSDYLIFQVAASDKMAILSGGNVGIGTTSPDEILHLYNASAGDTALKIETTSGGDPTIYMTSQAASRQGIISFQDNDINAGRIIYEHATDIMTFYTGGTGASHLELTLQETAGAVFRTKVGIGTGDPYSILEVTAPATKTNLGTVSNQTITCSGGGGVNEYNQIGFGYTAGDFSPGVIGYVTTNGAVSTLGALVFALRDSTTAIAPTERMRITSGGDVYIGHQSTNPTSGFSVLETSGGANIQIDHLTGTSTGHSFAVFRYNQSEIGSITQNGTSATLFNTSSDYRLKEDLKDFEGLDMVSKIPVYDFKWKSEESRSYGVIAHELQEVLPDAVSGEKDAEENQMVDYSKIVPLLVKSIQELKAEIDILKNK
jgi:hypothetical protein